MALLVLASTGLLAASAQAATYTVGTTSDLTGGCANPAAGTCSLRQLIEYEDSLPSTSEPDAIIMPAGQYDLNNGELYVTQSLVIVGAGPRSTHVDVTGSPARVFNVEPPDGGERPTVVISGLKITGGTGESGGDIFNAGQLGLIEDWIADGTASFGGGISNFAGQLYVSRSLIAENHASAGEGVGGGIENRGLGTSAATVAVEDSTVAENDARLGAGIYSRSEGSEEPAGNEVSVINSTIVENSTKIETGGNPRGPGAGLLIGDGTANVAGSIIAFNSETFENFVATNCATEGAGKITSLGYNLENTNDCEFTATGDMPETFPRFVEEDLEDNGGPTDTYMLEPTSPGVDAIPASFTFCNGTDQRGAPRPLGAGCDIGAVEVIPFTIFATEGSSFSGKVAEASTCGYESAITIDWGDGQTSGGTAQATEISGTHTYAAAGLFNGSVDYSTDCGERKVAFLAIVASVTPPPQPPVPVPSGPPLLLAVSAPSVITTTSATFTTTVNPHGLPTSVQFEYGPVLGGAHTSAITYGSVTPSQPVGSDFANHTVTATVTGLLPNVTYHVRAVATNGAGAAQGADQTLQTPADPPPPPPVLGKAVNVAPVSGVVYIQLPPGAKLAALSSGVPAEPAFAALTKGQRFIPLTEARQIPVGSILDTSAGVARIATATAQKGKQQFGNFGAGLFKLLQQRKQRGLTEMDIINTHTVRNTCATIGKKASIAKHLSSKTLGRLTGNAHGKFTTRGQYSAATVRGTIWQVTNRCDGTLTHVTRDVVTVRDFHRRKTITLLSGQSYLARAPR